MMSNIDIKLYIPKDISNLTQKTLLFTEYFVKPSFLENGVNLCKAMDEEHVSTILFFPFP